MENKKLDTLGFLPEADKIITSFCIATGKNKEIFSSEILEKLNNAPKGKYKIDSSDNMLKIGGVKMSFIRDWETGTAYICTNEEAQTLDRIDKKDCVVIIDKKHF